MDVVLCKLPDGQLGVLLRMDEGGIMSFDTRLHMSVYKFEFATYERIQASRCNFSLPIKFLLSNRPANVVPGFYEALCQL